MYLLITRSPKKTLHTPFFLLICIVWLGVDVRMHQHVSYFPRIPFIIEVEALVKFCPHQDCISFYVIFKVWQKYVVLGSHIFPTIFPEPFWDFPVGGIQGLYNLNILMTILMSENIFGVYSTSNASCFQYSGIFPSFLILIQNNLGQTKESGFLE